jgi:hypothetical protein
MSELLDEVRRLKEKMDARGHQARKEEAASWTQRTREDISALQRFLSALAGFFIWVYRRILRPLGRMSVVPAVWLWCLLRASWNRFVYIEDEFKNRRLSKRRAAIFTVSGLVFAWYVFIPMLVFLFDVALYLATAKRDEVVYLTNSQEIIPEDNVHSVQGCHQLPCTDENSFYFRIRVTLFNEIWSVVHGRGLFFPDYVAASVPLSISECKITSYGVRIKIFMRGMDIYPDLLQTECAPLQGGETEDAVPPAP